MGWLNFVLGRRRRAQEKQELEVALGPASEDRIVLVAALGAGSDILSDSQTGEIHRIFEHEGQLQIDAIPVVRRLLNRDIRLRNVGVLAVRGEEFENPFLGAHFVLDEYTRHIYRVLVTPRCCRAERLWGKGLDEVRERPLGGALIAWCDLYDGPARQALAAIQSLVPESLSWGLRFVSGQTEPGSDIERRLFVGALGAVRFHTRPNTTPTGIQGTEVAIEIERQERILLASHEPQARGKAVLRLRSEAGSLPF